MVKNAIDMEMLTDLHVFNTPPPHQHEVEDFGMPFVCVYVHV
jgi:hypothetical protein